LYDPGFNVTEVPLEEPENELGDGLLPETVMVKSDGFLVPEPPSLLVTFLMTLRNVSEPGGEGSGHLPLIGEESSFGQTHFPFDISEPSGHWHLPSTNVEPSGHSIGVGLGHVSFFGEEPSGQTHLPFTISAPLGHSGDLLDTF
jgi:hypothetical protein